jgi:hypothetical protein
VKDQTELAGGEPATATISAPVAVGSGSGFWRGTMYRTGVPYVPAAQETKLEIYKESSAEPHAFTRRVGARYSFQSLINSFRCSSPI